MRTKVHFVRHGEVDNPGGVLYGRLPGFGLSPLGLKMAEIAAHDLADRDVTAVFSSPLERALQTAGPIASQFGLEVVTDDRLIESSSVFEGQTIDWQPGAILSPQLLRYAYNPFRPSWGEPYAEVAARAHAAALAARDAARGHEAVCVSHQLPIYVLRRRVEGRHLWHRPDRRQCGLASIMSLEWTGDRLVALTYREPAGALARMPVPSHDLPS